MRLRRFLFLRNKSLGSVRLSASSSAISLHLNTFGDFLMHAKLIVLAALVCGLIAARTVSGLAPATPAVEPSKTAVADTATTASCCPTGACCPDGACCVGVSATAKTAATKASCCPGGVCCPDGACCVGAAAAGKTAAGKVAAKKASCCPDGACCPGGACCLAAKAAK